MQVSTNLADHQASIIRLQDISIAGTRLPDTQNVLLRNDIQKTSDPQDGLLPAAPFHSVFFDRTNATVIFSPSARVCFHGGLATPLTSPSQCRLKYCTARSWALAFSSVVNVPRLRRLPVFTFFLREYKRYSPDFNLRIMFPS
jgi:hypothetical protein